MSEKLTDKKEGDEPVGKKALLYTGAAKLFHRGLALLPFEFSDLQNRILTANIVPDFVLRPGCRCVPPSVRVRADHSSVFIMQVFVLGSQARVHAAVGSGADGVQAAVRRRAAHHAHRHRARKGKRTAL